MNTISTTATSPTTATSTRSTNGSTSDIVSSLMAEARDNMGTRNSRRPVIHKIFEQAATAYTRDTFWIKNLMMSARGMHPKGFIFSDGFLRYTKKTKITPTSIRISDNPIDAACEYIEFVKRCDKLLSDTDVAYNQQCQKMITETESRELSWVSASKKMRRSLVFHFANSEAQKNKLNKEQKNNLIHVIFYGIDIKVFQPETVIMVKDVITEIRGLIFNPETKTYSFKLPPLKPINLVPEKSVKKAATLKENQLNVVERWKIAADKFDSMINDTDVNMDT